MKPFEVGQSAYYVQFGCPPHVPVRAYPVTVTHVGRKWVTTTGIFTPSRTLRFNIETGLQHSGGYSSGRLYHSAEDWHEERDRQKAWACLRRLLSERHAPPEGVEFAGIHMASRSLGLAQRFEEIWEKQ